MCKVKQIDKVLNIRKNLKFKSGEPEKAFNNRLKYPKTILRAVESACCHAAIYEARRHYLVILAAAFEMFWRDLIKKLIDDNKLIFHNINKFRSISFTLQDVQLIADNKLSLGELLVTAYTFQSPETVNQVISLILDIDAFAAFRKEKYVYVRATNKSEKTKDEMPAEFVITGESILRGISLINKCFEIRHDTVHDSGNRHRVSKIDLIHVESATYNFIMFFGPFVCDLFESKGNHIKK